MPPRSKFRQSSLLPLLIHAPFIKLPQVEETWEVARKGTPAPMYRQRYGAA